MTEKDEITIVVCECGRAITPQGLAAHKRGIEHHASAKARALETSGWRQVHERDRFASMMRTERFLVIEALTGFQRGGPGKKSKLINQTWVRGWLLDLLQDSEIKLMQHLGVTQRSSRIQLELHALLRIWRENNTDPRATK